MKFLLKVAEYDCEIISEADCCMICFAKSVARYPNLRSQTKDDDANRHWHEGVV